VTSEEPEEEKENNDQTVIIIIAIVAIACLGIALAGLFICKAKKKKK
jgi:flagellar basal body-associated protein FliL